jgi:hypothetical protein
VMNRSLVVGSGRNIFLEKRALFRNRRVY